MSESTEASEFEGATSSIQRSLEPALIDSLLADFRTWLQELPSEAADSMLVEDASFDWATLVQQWIALRQEVNLQTRASRAQLEQNSQSLEQLTRTVEALKNPKPEATGDDKVRPLLKTLIDTHDSLALARREVEKMLKAIPTSIGIFSTPPEVKIEFPAWARMLGFHRIAKRGLKPMRIWIEQQKLAADPGMEELNSARQKVDAILVGYQMSLQRLERAIDQQGLEPIASVGQPFDPERMEALEVVRNSDRPNNEVVEEIRRGYLWQGRVFRFAQVRVAMNSK